MKVCLHCKYTFASKDWSCPSCGYLPKRVNQIYTHAPEFANCGSGFKPEYFSELSHLEAKNFWFRARNKLIIWALRTYKPDASSFLEVGCGTGYVLSGIARAFPRLSLSGSEIFLEGLSHAAKRAPSAHFMQMDARQLPFKKEFDAIGAFDVLEHIEEDEIVLDQLHNAVKPGGILLLTVPQHPWLWSVSDEYACHVRRYRRSEIEQKVLNAGFELLRSSSFVTSVLPAMIFSRFLKKEKLYNFNPAGELKINSILNILLYYFMIIEFATIRLGMNYRIGGSRLIVAKKKQ